MIKIIRIGSDGSDLAMWRANFLKTQLSNHNIESEIKVFISDSSNNPESSINKIEGINLFYSEIENALLHDEIDVVVDSLNELNTLQPNGLVLSAVSLRDDPSESLLIRSDS